MSATKIARYKNGAPTWFVTEEEALGAVENSKGFVTVVAKRLACSPQNVYALIKKHDSLRLAIHNEREATKDFAEGQLQKAIKEGNMTAIIFYLKTQASDRGYIEKQRVEHLLSVEADKFMDLLESKLDVETFQKVLEAAGGSSQLVIEG